MVLYTAMGDRNADYQLAIGPGMRLRVMGPAGVELPFGQVAKSVHLVGLQTRVAAGLHMDVMVVIHVVKDVVRRPDW